MKIEILEEEMILKIKLSKEEAKELEDQIDEVIADNLLDKAEWCDECDEEHNLNTLKTFLNKLWDNL